MELKIKQSLLWMVKRQVQNFLRCGTLKLCIFFWK